MANMQAFITWFLQQLPAFLMSEPLCYFVGFAFVFVVIRIIRAMIHLT